MKFKLFLLLNLFISGVIAAQNLDPRLLKSGDLIFHRSNSSQSEAIAQATHSQLTHMGIVFENNGSLYVYEAIGPVTATRLSSWINRGRGGKVLVKRLRNASSILNAAALEDLMAEALLYYGLPYDFVFNWSDDEIYCSELAWKVYKRALDIEIAPMEVLGDFDLSSPVVKKLLHERYGDDIPLEEPVISPVGIANSEELITVFNNF